MSEASKRAWFERHRQVNTWLERREFDAFKKLADAAGETVSEFARGMILAGLIRAAVERKRRKQ